MKNFVFDIDDLQSTLEEIHEDFISNEHPLEINWSKVNSKKSQLQVGYLYGYAYPQIRQFFWGESAVWYDIQVVHEWCIQKYCLVDSMMLRLNIFDLEVNVPPKRLSSMSMKETAKYITWLLDYMPTIGLYLKEPNFKWRDNGV